MRIKKIHLKNFKRFDNLTIDLGNDPKKIIALVGPNGCGKSSVFDAFEEKLKDYKGANVTELASFFSKLWHSNDPALKSETYNKGESIKIHREDDSENFDKKSFTIRSAYRFTPKLSVDSVRTKPSIIENKERPGSSIAIDSQLSDNYERLLGKLINEFFNGTKTGQETREEILGKINAILENILDIKISNLGDVTAGKGQLYFLKESSKDFPFENLSSGEKEVVDIIVDLIIKSSDYNNTVYCIDEPELHLNTAIQRKLLIEVEKLIPDNCQLWVATHSIGFLRALQTDLRDKTQVLDFSEKDYFNGAKTIIPINQTRRNWQRIFKTALEDLTGLIAPEKIIYCEGRADPTSQGNEQGLDATVYNEIFEETNPETLFISAGGGIPHINHSAIALQILSKAFQGVELFLLKDKDEKTDAERTTFISSTPENKMLTRREIENYLFDIEILKNYSSKNGRTLDEQKYSQIVIDIKQQDLKLGQILQSLQHLCGASGSISDFKIELAKYIIPETSVYSELKGCIF